MKSHRSNEIIDLKVNTALKEMMREISFKDSSCQILRNLDFVH
jgi:hypothetical protein